MLIECRANLSKHSNTIKTDKRNTSNKAFNENRAKMKIKIKIK